jgi:predicted TIM-barrel fold metal-dependent hydrolase
MDAYTHLDMSASDAVNDFQSRMARAGIDRALAVETWSGNNFTCLTRLIDLPQSQFRIAVCFRPERQPPPKELLSRNAVVGLRVKTEDLQRLGDSGVSLESSGKWIVTHAEKGIGALTTAIGSLVRQHPQLRVYVPHLAWPRRDGADDEDWPLAVTELSHIPGVVVGISAVAHFSRESFPHRDIEAFASRVTEIFPADSVAIGSDYPLFEKNRYAEYMGLAREWIRKQGAEVPSRLEATCFHESCVGD